MVSKKNAQAERAIINKRITLPAEVWLAVEALARESRQSLQQLADEAFADLLKKHHRPVGLKAALKASIRTLPANDPQQPSTRKTRL